MKIHDAESVFTLQGLVEVVRRHWWFPVMGTACGLMLAVAKVLLSQPVYRAEIIAVPANTQETSSALTGLMDRLGGLSTLAGINIGSGQGHSEGMAILRSRALVGEFIRDEKLLSELYPDRWDAGSKRWRSTDPQEQPTIYKAQEFFLQNVLRVTDDRTTGLVTIRVEWTDRKQCVDWVTKIVGRANAKSQRMVLDEAERSVKFLQERLKTTESVELQQGIYRLIEAQLKQIVVASARPEFAFKVIDPADLPDVDSYVRPRRRLLVVLGAAAGFVLGFAIAAWRFTRQIVEAQSK